MNLHVDGFLRERVMMLKLSNNLAKPWNRWLKRSLDLILAALFTLLVLPLGLILAALIKLDSEGPALFVQERIGYWGRNFRCYKFRTMSVKGDEQLAQYLDNHPDAADEWRRYAKLRKYDPAPHPLGTFSAPLEPGRTAATPERPQRGNEFDRAAPVSSSRALPHRRQPFHHTLGPAGCDRTVAGERAQPCDDR